MLNRTSRRCALVCLALAVLATPALADPNIVIKQAPPLPPPTGDVVYVSNVSQLESAITTAPSGRTIMVNPGTYYTTKNLAPGPGVTIRGATGNRDDVVLRGAGMNNSAAMRHVFWLRYSNITIADLTLRDAYYHGIQIAAEYQTDNIWLRNLKILDCGERFIKGSTNNNPSYRPDNVTIEYCWLEQITPLANHNDLDYIGGIDVMWCNNWVIRDNVMKNIRGASQGGRGGIFIWNNAQNVVVERNLVTGCDRGIAVGNPSGSPYHLSNSVVRNNFVVRGAGIAMEICMTNNVKVYNNTIYSDDPSYFRTLHVNSSNPGLQVYDNLIRGQILYSSGGSADTAGSIIGGAVLSTWFVEPLVGDLRLTAAATSAINTATVRAEVTDDYFAQPRGGQPDKGAYEIPSPPQVTAATPALAQVQQKAAALNTITITFSQDVAIAASNVTIAGVNTGAHNDFSFSYSGAAKTATLSWAAGLPNDTYVVTVSDAVTAGGVALDGEQDIHSPVLPSGDGTAGGSFSGLIYRLVGDITGDRKVNVFDLQRLGASWNKQVGQVGYDAACDLTGDGKVNVFDLQALGANWNQQIPVGP